MQYVYKDPVELPCEDYICKAHLIEKEVVQKNKIKCLICSQEFPVKGNEFKLDKLIQTQINEQIYLSDEEISLKLKIEESIKLFYEMYDDFISSKTKLESECHNHFQEIRFQLDIHREKLKEKIDEIYMEMIDKTKEFEASLLKSLDEKLFSSLNSFEIKTIDENLKEVEETFRYPQLLIKTIQEMNLKQEVAVKIIQSKQNEMNQVKDNLKKSYEFKPNLNFNQDFFGQLDLGQYSSLSSLKSQILNGRQSLDLTELCEFNPKDKFKLLYRASQDGFESSNFHLKCDGHGNTLTILKANGFLFGGFTKATWSSSGQWKSDKDAFLFSLTNKDYKPCKIKIDSNKLINAIYCISSYGPKFGLNDIFISSNSNTNTQSFSNLGICYQHPQYDYGTNEA